MKLSEKFGIVGMDDDRVRRSVFPTRVVLSRGNVTGQEYLKEFKPRQVAIYSYHDQCTLDNRESGVNAAVLVDFGRELHGTLNISVWSMSSPHCEFRVRLGESVSEALTPIGTKNATNDHAERDTVFGAGPWSSNETCESGFRFAYIELTTPGVYAELRSVAAIMIYRDIDYKGHFECSDPLIEKIYDTAAYTVHLNMQRYLWDGIKRDRLVWAGDMNTEVAAILAVFGYNEVVPKSLDLVRDVTPAGSPMNGLSSYNLWWLICHRDWYMGTGDYDYLRAQREYIAEMLSRYVTFVNDDGSEAMPDGRFFDWPTNDDIHAKHCGLQGLMRYAMNAGGEIMKALGESAVAESCYLASEKLGRHIPAFCENKQSSAMLVMGSLIEPEKCAVDCIEKGGARGLSTFLGYYTLSALAKAGHYSSALDTMREYWGGMLKMGATTFWEDFNVEWTENSAPIDDVVPLWMRDIHGDFGAYCYRGLRHSLCHGWACGPTPYLAANVLGIKPLTPGYGKVRIEPHLSGLEWAAGAVPTPHGVIEVEATRGENGIERVSVKLPSGVEAV